MTEFAPLERAALADLMQELGPDAPTLCVGWTTRDLAAHLVVRATRADAAAGIVIPGLAGHTKRVQDRVAGQQWSTLVRQVRHRPWWAALSDEAFNRVEYFVHHEDIRRAQPGWRPRELSDEFSAALWSRVRAQAKLVLRKTPATVSVTAAGFAGGDQRGNFAGGDQRGNFAGGDQRGNFGTITAGRGGPAVDLAGPPQELLLFLTGRQPHALVELAGPDAITARMRTARYGI